MSSSDVVSWMMTSEHHLDELFLVRDLRPGLSEIHLLQCGIEKLNDTAGLQMYKKH